MMSELYDQIIRQRGSTEDLFARIPGFRGYLEKATRRTADQMIRDFIADALTERINRFVRAEKTLLDHGGLNYMSKTASAKLKLQTYRDRVKTAAPGFSGFMAAVKINEQELERIYAFDEAQMRYLDKIDAGLETLERAAASGEAESINAAIAELDRLVVEANDAFNLRDDVITNIDNVLRTYNVIGNE